MAAAVEIEHLTKSFGAGRAVDDVDLVILPGELFFLLGPSGCGKTTLLRCIAGFCRPDAGAIRFDGLNLTDTPPHRRNTGMVFQSYALWPHMTVRENVAFGLECRRVPPDERRRRVDEMLALVRLGDRAEARPQELSGGQQQRVALARALVVRPHVLLLDEPLSNLDAQLRLEMRADIRRLCKQTGLTTLYVTHDQKEALSIADRLAIMNRGRLEQCGAPHEVYRQPANVFVAGFIGETNLLPATVTERQAGRLRLQTGLGPVVVTVPDAATWQPGNRVLASLRPEILRLGAPPGGGPNVFRGAAHDTSYLGEIAQQQVTLEPGGVEWKVFEIQPRIIARDGRREPVSVWFAPDDAVILPP